MDYFLKECADRFGDNNSDSGRSKRLALRLPFGCDYFCDDRWKLVTLPVFRGGITAGKGD